MAKKEKTKDLSEYSFMDTKGRIWNCKLTLAIAQKIDGTDFSEITDLEFVFLQPDEEFFKEIFTNVRLQFALIWVIVRDQNPEVQDEFEFTEALDGNSVTLGREALFESLSDFFLDQRNFLQLLKQQRESLKRIMDEKMSKANNQVLEKAGPMMDDVLEKEIKKIEEKVGQISTSS